MQEILSGGGAGHSRHTKMEGENLTGEGFSFRDDSERLEHRTCDKFRPAGKFTGLNRANRLSVVDTPSHTCNWSDPYPEFGNRTSESFFVLCIFKACHSGAHPVRSGLVMVVGTGDGEREAPAGILFPPIFLKIRNSLR
jgi:hypothetical protein